MWILSWSNRELFRSKLGISRTLRVLPDLLAVFFSLHYRARPGHYFGTIGLVPGALGSIIMAYLTTIKFGFGESFGVPIGR